MTYINPGSVGLGLNAGFCAQYTLLNLDNDTIKTEFISLKYDSEEVIKCIKESELSKTRIKWYEILIKTIEDSIDYSDLYITTVLDISRVEEIERLDDITIDIWDEAREEINI